MIKLFGQTDKSFSPHIILLVAFIKDMEGEIC